MYIISCIVCSGLGSCGFNTETILCSFRAHIVRVDYAVIGVILVGVVFWVCGMYLDFCRFSLSVL